MATALAHVSVADALRILRDAMKDHTYRTTPLGTMVGRYMRWLRNEYGATPSTQRDYEAILARMCLTLPDRELIEVTTEDLREVIDLWAMRQAKTRAKVTSVIRSFWQWCEDQDLVPLDPSRKIRRPRVDKKVARVLPLDARPRLLSVAKHPRDRLALHCLLGLGLRRAELAGITFRDFDAQRGMLRVYGKGRKERLLPLRGTILDEVRLALTVDLPHVGRPPVGDDFLLYPVKLLAYGKGSEGQALRRAVPDPKKPMSAPAIHRWWYRQAADAGLVGHGVTSGLNMHQARHTFAMELRRVAGIDAASHALGHSDLSTTLGIYGHFDAADLSEAMESHAAWVAAQDGFLSSED